MRVVVTGAAGFIGSHLVHALVGGGHDVVAVDSPGRASSASAAAANIRVLGEIGVALTVCDLATDDLGPLVEADTVLHLAGRPGVRTSWGSGAVDTHRDNVAGTERLLSACAGRRPRVVFASSSSVYGNADAPCSEDDPVDPQSPYARSKADAEELMREYGGVVLRYFSVYGPRQRPDMAFHRFIKAALDGRPAPVYGDGTQSRSFTYVGDVVDATIRAARTPLPEGTVLNVGSPVTTSVRDALDRIAVLLGTAPPTVTEDAARGDVQRTWAGTERAKELLGWVATTGLAEGLARQIAWHRETHRETRRETHWETRPETHWETRRETRRETA